jgi:hypothetical protein
MILKELKKVSLSELAVLILLIIILLQRCGRNPENPTVPQITRDTVWVHKDSTIISKPQVVKTIPVNIYHDTTLREYLPDTNYAKLVKQYTELAEKFLAMNIQADSFKVDSIGHVYIIDTVSHNLVKSRSFRYNLKYPQITTTITIPEPKKVEWYIGGFLQGEEEELINQISAGLLIKNKKDQIFGGHIGLNTFGKLQVGFSSYWKIKPRK